MLQWGRNESAIGPIFVGMKTLAAAREWPVLGFGEVVIDFNHNSVPGHPSYKGEPVPLAARSCTLSVVPGEGLVFENIQWTDEGRANRANYPDLSPAVKTDAAGEVLFCHSAAVARNGAVSNLHLLSAGGRLPMSEAERHIAQTLGISEERWHRTGHAADLLTFAATQSLTSSESAAEVATASLRENVCLLLGLPDDATDDDINAALADLEAGFTDIEKKKGAQRHATELQAMKERLKALQGNQSADAAQEAGQLRYEIARGEEAQRGVVGLSATVPISATDRDVMQRLGLSEAQWRKYA